MISLYSGKPYTRIVAFLTLLAVLAWMAPGRNYLQTPGMYVALHTLLEFSSIAVSLMVFVVGNSVARFRPANSLRLVGILFLAVALLDILHVASVEGMPALVTPSSTDKAAFLWLAARLFALLAVVAFALLPDRLAAGRERLLRWALPLVLALVGAIVAMPLLAPQVLPRMYIPGSGLTPAKQGTEYLLIASHALLALLLLRRSKRCEQPARDVVRMLALASWMMALTESFFPLFGLATDLFNFLGHVYKAIAYYLVYRALVQANIEYPYMLLEQAQERLELALRGSNDGLWDWNLRTGELYLSPRWKAILGYDDAELPNQPSSWQRLVDDAGRTLVARLLQTSGNASTAPYELEFRMRHKLGHWVDILSRGCLQYAADGRPLRLVGTQRDISERKRQLDVLARKELELQTIIDSEPDAVQLLDGSGNIVETNRSGVLMLDAERPEQVVGMSLAGMVAVELRAEFMALIQQVFAGGSGNLVYSVQTLQGRRRWLDMHAVPLFDPQRRIKAVLALTRDISERRQTEDRLRKLSLVVEQSPNSIVITDTRGSIEYVNDAFCRVSQYTREEVLGRNPRILQSGLTPRETYEQMWQTLSSGEIWRGVLTNRRKDGSIYVEDALLSPVRQPDGSVSHYLAIKNDITRRREIEAELEQHRHHLDELVRARTDELANAKEAAEAANRAKSDFLANMSHEMRTPMNSIIGMAHLALQTELTPKQRDYLDKIHHSGQLLLAIINDILDLSKIEAGMLEFEDVDFALADVEHWLADLFAEKILTHNVAFSFDVDPALDLPLRGDPLRLAQVLSNLIGNAFKFTSSGAIAVRARAVSIEAPQVTLYFEVEDSGIGMSAEECARLFQPFQQADSSTTRKYGGTGLGLAISKKLVQRMNGEIGVDSRPGQGSKFWFTVRLAIGDGQRAAAGLGRQALQPADLARIRGACILLVEDSPFNQMVAQELLQQAGASVVTAGNGIEALALLAEQTFDAVLMDLQMPQMDGLEATRRIRSNPALAGLRVIAMTANASREDRERCLSAGMDDFITKPVVPDHLYAVLGKWLSQRSEVSAEATAVPASSNVPVGAIVGPVPAPASTLPAGNNTVLDLEVLRNIVGGQPDRLRKFTGKFVDSAQTTLQEIDVALARGDLAELGALGHRLKSGARSIGAGDFALLCEALEGVRNGGTLEQARQLVQQMQEQLQLLQQQITEQLG